MSILAELVMLACGGTGLPLRETTGAIHPRLTPDRPPGVDITLPVAGADTTR